LGARYNCICMPATLPNIIYINSHDTGRYIQPYGHAIDTPHLQKLAEEGVIFRHSFSAAPTCSPSRAALTLGQVPHSCGIFGLGHRGFHPDDVGQHIAHYLRKAGYQTATQGMMDNHIGTKAATGADWDEVHLKTGYERRIGQSNDDNAVTFIREQHDRPFFLSVSYGMTHRQKAGFATAPDWRDDPRYTATPPTLADTPEIRADWAHFKSDARELDRAMGQIFQAVREAGLEENTLIIATTDHGPAFPGMKCNMTVHGTGVFLIVKGPGGFTGGKVVEALVSQIDLFPTICDLIGQDRPGYLQGESLLPLVNDQKSELHDFVISEVTYHAAYEPKRCYREKRWVYVKRFGDRRKPVLPNCDASPSKEVWLADGYAERLVDEEELYDTFYDPQELANLAYHPRYQEKLAEMRGKLERWMEESNDPLCHGDIPCPAEAWTNDPDEIHAGPKP